jgi:vacuolar protein-sorting-associated protein 4
LVLAATNVPWEIDPAFRRRFEKRIYIPLPDAVALARMFELNLGKTPHNLTQEDFVKLGEMAPGFSGSDISVVTREALMEPLRKCRTARYWYPHSQLPAAAPAAAGTTAGATAGATQVPRFVWAPLPHSEPGADNGDPWRSRNPPCSHCVPDTVSAPAPRKIQCPSCKCARIDMFDLDQPELYVPVVCMDDFLLIMPKARASVAQSELVRYAEWTKQFGQDGGE